VHWLSAEVDGQQEPAARTQAAEHLAERGRVLVRRDVDDRVEGRDSRPLGVWDLKTGHVPHPELEIGLQPPRGFNHAGGQVDSEHVQAARRQVLRDVSRSATQVADRAAPAYTLGEAVQEFAVERLVLELAVDAARILIGDAVVAGSYGVAIGHAPTRT
jgi:hypothetical protein